MKTATYYIRKPFAYVDEVTAHKVHTCKICNKEITPNQLYWRKTGMTEKGQFYRYKYCDACFSTCNE